MLKKYTINYLYLTLFLSIFFLHYFQTVNQHWSGVLDQDLIIIYNSILLNSGIEQEYRDHPAFTTFIIHSIIYKLSSLFTNVPTEIGNILNSKNINEIFQLYFYISRGVNFFINLLLFILFNKILKKLEIEKIHRFLICIVFITSIGYVSSFFFIRSENVSLLFLFFSINIILSKKRNLIFNSFISGIFFAIAMFAKIQIIFLALYLIFLISYKNRNIKNEYKIHSLFKNYLFFSLLFGFIIFFIFQIYIQNFPRFITNKYIDLIILSLSIISFLFYFHKTGNLKKNLLVFSSMMNGFVFFIICIFFLDKINLLQVNDFIFLRITNPIHYMTEFTGNLANGTVNISYIIQNILKVVSKYRFNLLELFLILSLGFIYLKKNHYIPIVFFIFLINTLVMNFRYTEVYHLFYVFIYLMLFVELTKSQNYEIKSKFLFLIIVIFLSNSLYFFVIKKDNYLNVILNRDNGMVKICNELKFGIKPNTYENLNYIKYWHHKLNDEKIIKICEEIL